MKRICIALIALIVASGITACGGESSVPVATGKGSVRTINAIPTSPEFGFLIEERLLDGVSYKSNSSPRSWDNLHYIFNFEIVLAGDLTATRVASEALDVVADVEYTFLISGSLATPTITIWEIAERDFSGTETIFEMRIGHAADALGPVDVYVALDGTAPVLGEQVATLAPGEVSTTTDLEQESYVITVTAVDDPTTVIYQSVPTFIVSNQSVLVTIFEGVANDTAPYTVRIFNQLGLSAAVPDARFPPTARFVHATMDLATSDVYDDALLQNQIVSNLAFGDITADIDVNVGESPITFTAAGNPGAILFESILTAFPGTRVNYYMTVAVFDSALAGVPAILDLRSIETLVKLTFYHSAINNQLVDMYVVDADELIDEALPRQILLAYGTQAPTLTLGEGSFDVYITTSGEKTILDGPIRIDVSLGDVIQAVLIDRVDPTQADFNIFPPP
ncbi:MAG: DUF4397 domain-containing protein [Woeseiaceae bacterium]|nr:DUF4397 domain-containing protein [Woeseiaceae bacterium]